MAQVSLCVCDSSAQGGTATNFERGFEDDKEVTWLQWKDQG